MTDGAMDLRFDRLGDDAIGIALAPRYQTVTGPEVDVERTWLDRHLRLALAWERAAATAGQGRR